MRRVNGRCSDYHTKHIHGPEEVRLSTDGPHRRTNDRRNMKDSELATGSRPTICKES